MTVPDVPVLASAVPPPGALPPDAADGGFGELRAGPLGVRLAVSDAEVRAAQSLRFRIFFEEMGAAADPVARATRRDADVFDSVADHMLIVDHAAEPGAERIVGTYRLIRREAAARIGRFYSADEYDIAPILAQPGGVLELGRSCVHADYRGRPAIQLMWRGIAAYVDLHRIEVMFGCASLHGIDPDALAVQLSYLYHHHLAPPGLRPRALPDRYVDMQRMAPDLIDRRRALASLPPLIKGYLRLGGFVGDGAVIDRPFNTTDVAVVVKTDLITGRYNRHYGRPQTRGGLD